ncbi:hypothetical protein BGW39_003744 [Mortierella sp. 14UC]|nr:hypothetical protein BGW39_003744 [Mortierella sp. 14UC]
MVPFAPQRLAALALILLFQGTTTTTFCLANTNNLADNILSAYQSLKDHADRLSLDNPILHFKLDRRELTPSHLQARSIRKPYSVGESLFVTTPPPPSPIRPYSAFPLSSSSSNDRQLASSWSTSSTSSGYLSALSGIELSVPMTSIPKEYGYTAAVSIGTYSKQQPSTGNVGDGDGEQLFNLLVDTGSDLVAVTSAACTDPECLQVRHRYDPSLSLTAAPTRNHLTNEPRWAQIFGDGTVANGTLVQDTLRFMSSVSASSMVGSGDTSSRNLLEVLNQPILVIDQPGLHLVKSYGTGVDGILGMNLRSLVVGQTVIQNLQRQDAEELNSVGGGHSLIGFMGLWLGKSMEAGEGGELVFNGIDRSKIRDPIVWSDRGPSPFDWSVPLDRGILLVDPLSSSLTTSTSPSSPSSFTLPNTNHTFAVLDSGSDGIYLQRSTYDALFLQIPSAKRLKTGYWRVPCQGPQLELWICIQGETYKIPYKEWVKRPNAVTSSAKAVEEVGEGMCQTKVFGSSPGPTLLGATFLRRVYSVFDFRRAGEERVGLARLVASSFN